MICECAVGVDQLTFIYSGVEGGSVSCSFASGETPSDPVQMNGLSSGQSIVLDVPEGVTSISCSAFDENSYPVVTSMEVDASCNGERDLVLMQEFGGSDTVPAVLTFIGYACNASSVEEVSEMHFCIIDVDYEIEICNTGGGTETITSVTFTVTEDGVSNTYVYDENPPIGAVLGPPGSETACLTLPYTDSVDVCTERIYNVNTVVEVVAPPNTEEPCVGTATMDYKTSENSVSPTNLPSVGPSSMPSYIPSASPSTSSPSSNPSDSPSASPTGFPTFATVTESPSKEPSSLPSYIPSASPSTSSPSSNPSSAPTPCPVDPCIEIVDETIPDDGCDPCVPIIKIKDSWCGKEWDKWCVALYAQCCPQAGCPASAIEAVQMPDECPEELRENSPDNAEVGDEYSEFRTPWRTTPAP